MLRVLRDAVRGIYLLLLQRGEGRRLEGELEGSCVVVTQLRRELDLRGHGVVGAEGVVAAGAGNGHLRIGQVFVQALVELVLVLTANLHAHDGGVAVLTNLGLVITATGKSTLQSLFCTSYVRAREGVEETCFHGTVQAQGSSHLHALHSHLLRKVTAQVKDALRRGRARVAGVINPIAVVGAVLQDDFQAVAFRRAQQRAVQHALHCLAHIEGLRLFLDLSGVAQIGGTCTQQLLQLSVQVVQRGCAEGQGATHFFLRRTGRSRGSHVGCLGRLQTLLQLGALRLDLVQVGVDRSGGLRVHDVLRYEGGSSRVATVLFLKLKNHHLEATVLHVLRRNGGTAGILHFLLAELHSGFAAATVEHTVLVGGFNNTINYESFREPFQQLLRAEVFLHLDTLHQTLLGIENSDGRLGLGTSSLQDRSYLGTVLIHRGEGNGEGRTCLVAIGLNTTVFQALGQVLTHGRIQSLRTTLNLVLVVLEVKGNQHGAGTLLSALKAKLGLNLRTAGAQNQGGNGQQNRQEHPALTSRCTRGVSHCVHTRLPSGE